MIEKEKQCFQNMGKAFAPDFSQYGAFWLGNHHTCGTWEESRYEISLVWESWQRESKGRKRFCSCPTVEITFGQVLACHIGHTSNNAVFS